MVLITAASAIAQAYNGPWPYTAIVASFANPDWYSELKSASGQQQKNHTTSIGGGYDGDIWGRIVDSSRNSLTGGQPPYSGTDVFYNSGAAAGKQIGFAITSEWWVPVNVEVNRSWYS